MITITFAAPERNFLTGAATSKANVSIDFPTPIALTEEEALKTAALHILKRILEIKNEPFSEEDKNQYNDLCKRLRQ